jgi:propionate CoA-transferase
MRPVEWLTPEQAVARIPSEAVLATGGFVGCGHPEALTRALGERFQREGKPANLTLVYAAGQGDGCNRGLNHLAERGLLRRVVGGHWNLAPRLGALAAENEIEAYSFPQGVISKMFRAAASGDPGVLSRVGIGTFVDPRSGGGRMNASTKEDLVQTIEIDGETLLFYRTLPVNAALIRATSSDSFGGLSFEREANVGEALSIAQCAKRNGGIVIAQVERRVVDYTRDPKSVRVPGIFVDIAVIADPAEHSQTFRDAFCEDFIRQGPVGDLRLPSLTAGPRRSIASRALAEVPDGAILNLGIGMPEALAQLAAERGCLDRFNADSGSRTHRGRTRGRPVIWRVALSARGDRPALHVRLSGRRRSRHRVPEHGRMRFQWKCQCEPIRVPYARTRRIYQHRAVYKKGSVHRYFHGRSRAAERCAEVCSKRAADHL